MEIRKTMFLQQRRLIVLFLLTIVLPSLTLSVFGIQAIRNEKYRKEQENVAELQSAINLFRRQVASQLDNVESSLLSIEPWAVELPNYDTYTSRPSRPSRPKISESSPR